MNNELIFDSNFRELCPYGFKVDHCNKIYHFINRDYNIIKVNGEVGSRHNKSEFMSGSEYFEDSYFLYSDSTTPYYNNKYDNKLLHKYKKAFDKVMKKLKNYRRV